MNIMWVEDFGGNLPADSKTLVPLFQGLMKRETFVKHWDDEGDLLAEPAMLSDFFAKHSIHKVVLLRNVFDYLDRVAQRDWTKHDVFAIDINLGQRVDAGRDLPADIRSVEKSAFHRKAGFYIYNHLIRNGMPSENICFLTGEKESTLEFAEHCRIALMPQPTAFSKSDGGFAEFREWLRQRREDPYVTLRRGIIEGCEYLRSRVEVDETVIQFGEFAAVKGGDLDRVNRDEILGYIDTLQALLPPIGHTEERSALEEQRIEHLYRLFVRTLAHEWEDAASPRNLRRDMAVKRKNILGALGWIMKNVRNWMAHTSVINRLEAQDVAFIFLINMRAMFDLGSTPITYEKMLLGLFSTGDDRPGNHLHQEQLRDALVNSYRRIKERVLKARQTRDAVSFVEMANNLVLGREDSPGASFIVLLYQMFWHGLSPARLTNTAPAKDLKTGERNVALYFTFNCRAENYRSTVGEGEDFLYQFALAFYRRSFPQ